MAPVDRTKYMDEREVSVLRTVAEAHAITDMQAGRLRGVLAWAVLDVALQTGLRASEIVRLKVGDFDPRHQSLRVWRHKRRKQGQETMAVGKSLSKHLRDFIAWKRSAGQGTDKDDPLFVGKRGPLTKRGLQQVWTMAIAKAGLPAELSIHCARHTMAVHLLRKSGNLRMVQKQLGHGSPSTTANMYADISFEDMRAGVDGLFDRGPHAA